MLRGHSLRQLLRLSATPNPSVHTVKQVAWQGFRTAVSDSRTLLSRQPSRPDFATDVLKPAAFGVFGTGAAFAVAAHFDQQLRRQQHRYGLYGEGKTYLPESDIRFLAKLPPGFIRHLAASAIEQWRSLLPHQQTLYGITGINLCVLAAWRVRRLQIFMTTNFLHTFPPLPTRTYTLLTSAFSHRTIPHFLFNSLALISFGGEVHQHLGSNQFMAFFTGGALTSSVLSHLARAKSRPGGASLGSSGAVYAVFAMMAYLRPEAEAYFIFLPGVPITLQTLFPCLIALDVTGILLKWRMLDHWGHLGGAVFGYLYARYGEKYIWANRTSLLPQSDDK